MKESIKKARELNGVTTLLIEGYDDAGLYYYEIGDYENSARFQSVAVLLSYSLNKNDRMNSVYLKRLGWAFEKYISDFDFSHIKDNPENLLCDNILNIKKNKDIKMAYYRTEHHVQTKANNNYILKDGLCNS